MEFKEFGGYLELEKNNGKEYIDGLTLNTSRNCLQFLIRNRKIKKIYIPYYLCLVIEKTCINEKIDIIYYHIDNEFKPILSNIKINNNEYIYVVNYFGLLSEEYLKSIKEEFKNIILDNTHSFYERAIDKIDTIYNCRKYFGVPDGAYLISDLEVNIEKKEIPQAISLNRLTHLFGRFEEKAQYFYSDFTKAEQELDNRDIELMSKITHNMLRGIDYDLVYKIRMNNYKILFKELSKINTLNISKVGTYMYPLLIKNGKKLRNYLIKKNIYIPKLWPDLDKFELNDFEIALFENLVPLPIDQRYNDKDMYYLIDTIKEYLKLESGSDIYEKN